MNPTTGSKGLAVTVDIPRSVRGDAEAYRMHVRTAYLDAAMTAYEAGWDRYTVRVDLAAARVTATVEETSA